VCLWLLDVLALFFIELYFYKIILLVLIYNLLYKYSFINYFYNSFAQDVFCFIITLFMLSIYNYIIDYTLFYHSAKQCDALFVYKQRLLRANKHEGFHSLCDARAGETRNLISQGGRREERCCDVRSWAFNACI
jgi:hypothetical protein